ncbi:hypothetical protein KZX45_18390 [Georgenia sp. EYE_87]|uniref:hypothetical protein n=1 Tax=Georgenia sp. EYE_87 TaxID=2853448 RepID=UPI002002F9E0|nr:hypothetical protein [Georgenia sp. EYE_87]MCK6212510.1 hypothetical protein [Georgenia sp. EYE_87]
MAAQQTTSSARWQAALARFEGRHLAVLAVGLGVLALALAVVGLAAAVVRPSLALGPSSGAVGATLTTTAEAYTFTDPDEAAAVYSVRNDSLLPVTVRSGRLEDGGAVEVLGASAGSEDFFARPAVPSRTVAAGEEVAVRVTADWPPCGDFAPGSGVVRTEIIVVTTVLGVPGSAVVELSPGLGLRAAAPVEAADDCEGVLHVDEGR